MIWDSLASPVAQLVKTPPAMQETPVRFLDQKICWRRNRLPTPVFLGFPHGSDGKESACNVGDLGLISGLGISPGEGKGYPLQYSSLENSMDYIVHGVTKSQTQLSNFHLTYHSQWQHFSEAELGINTSFMWDLCCWVCHSLHTLCCFLILKLIISCQALSNIFMIKLRGKWNIFDPHFSNVDQQKIEQESPVFHILVPIHIWVYASWSTVIICSVSK